MVKLNINISIWYAWLIISAFGRCIWRFKQSTLATTNCWAYMNYENKYIEKIKQMKARNYKSIHRFQCHISFIWIQGNIKVGVKLQRYVWSILWRGDDLDKPRPPPVHPAYELFHPEQPRPFERSAANALAQNVSEIPSEGILIQCEDHGLDYDDGDDMTVVEAAGGIDIDPAEREKIAHILPTIEGNGFGLCILIGARQGHFVFDYRGPIAHLVGVQAWIRYMIKSVVKDARISMMSQHSVDRELQTMNTQRLREETNASIERTNKFLYPDELPRTAIFDPYGYHKPPQMLS